MDIKEKISVLFINLYYPAMFTLRLDYFLSLRQPSYNRLTFVQIYWNLTADYLFTFVYQSLFYYVASH